MIFPTCASLGKVFSSFAAIKEQKTEEDEFLFTEDTVKKMKSDLKKLPVQASKNFQGSGKSTRGHFHGNNSNNNNILSSWLLR